METSAVSEHAIKTGHYPLWEEVTLIDRDPHWYSRRVNGAIQLRRQPNNINRDSGIEIPEAWMPTIRQHDSQTATTTDRWGISFLLWKYQQCFGSKPNQPWARVVIHQSLTTTVVQIVRLSKSTLPPNEDLHCAVETWQLISKWQSWDRR